MKLEFSRQFFEKYAYMLSFKQILSVEAELLHADRRTDVTNLTICFHPFANAPKNATANEHIKCLTYLY